MDSREKAWEGHKRHVLRKEEIFIAILHPPSYSFQYNFNANNTASPFPCNMHLCKFTKFQMYTKMLTSHLNILQISTPLRSTSLLNKKK
jgi:hypothetical protein